MKSGEHGNKGLKDVLQKNSPWPKMAFRWRNRIFENKIGSARKQCFQHSGEAKK